MQLYFQPATRAWTPAFRPPVDDRALLGVPQFPFGMPPRFGVSGLRAGNPPGSAASIASVAAQGAAATGGILSGLAAMGALSPAFAIAGPIGAAVAGLTALGIAIANEFQGCGQTCIEATTIANNVGNYLAQNVATYLAAPVHYASLQAAALNNFQTAWNGLVSGCGAASLSTAGQNCISQRQQGACAYHSSPGGWQQQNGVWTFVPPGANGSGTACWNFWVGYHDPIANDPTVVPDPDPANPPATVSPTSVVAGSASAVSPTLLWIGLGVLAAAVVFAEK